MLTKLTVKLCGQQLKDDENVHDVFFMKTSIVLKHILLIVTSLSVYSLFSTFLTCIV